MLDVLAIGITLLALVGIIFFTLWYGFLHNWTQNSAGIWLMTVFTTLTFAILLSFANLLWPIIEDRRLIRILVWTPLACALIGLNITAVRGWIKGGKSDPPNRTGPIDSQTGLD